MKKILAAAAAALVLSACSSGVTQEQYDQAVAEVSQYSAELEEEKAANEALNKELSEAKGNYEELSKEYSSYEESMNAYKESMAEYEGLAEAEVERRRIEAESIAESESIAKEESKAAEEASKEASRAADAFCAVQWPPVRLPVATQRCQWPVLIRHFPFNHYDVVLCHPLEKRVG